MALTHHQELGVSLLAGAICAGTAWFLRQKWRAYNKEPEPLSSIEFAEVDWRSLEGEQLESKILQALLSRPGLCFDFHDPWVMRKRKLEPKDLPLKDEYTQFLVARVIAASAAQHDKEL